MIVSDGSGTFSHFSRVAGGCDSLGESVVVVLFSALVLAGCRSHLCPAGAAGVMFKCN